MTLLLGFGPYGSHRKLYYRSWLEASPDILAVHEEKYNIVKFNRFLHFQQTTKLKNNIVFFIQHQILHM